jgi:hypothetical protein
METGEAVGAARGQAPDRATRSVILPAGRSYSDFDR